MKKIIDSKIAFAAVLILALVPFTFLFKNGELLFFMLRDNSLPAICFASLSAGLCLFFLSKFSREELLALAIFFGCLPLTSYFDGQKLFMPIWDNQASIVFLYWINSAICLSKCLIYKKINFVADK